METELYGPLAWGKDVGKICFSFAVQDAIQNVHALPRGPFGAKPKAVYDLQLYSAIQRYTLYSYTSL